eukprot:2947250-Amphidinium_carterae.1
MSMISQKLRAAWELVPRVKHCNLTIRRSVSATMIVYHTAQRANEQGKRVHTAELAYLFGHYLQATLHSRENAVKFR